MTKRQKQKFERILTHMEQEVSRGLLNQRGGLTIETQGDIVDQVHNRTERELAIQNLDQDSRLLRAIRSALRRLRQGDYGICEECEEEIAPRRLEAVPWTSLCLRCQELMEASGAAPESSGSDSRFESMASRLIA